MTPVGYFLIAFLMVALGTLTIHGLTGGRPYKRPKPEKPWWN